MKTVLRVAALTLLFSGSAWAVIGGGEITFHPSGAAAVTFSHEFHVMQKMLKCSQCHNAIFVPGVSAFTTSMAEMNKGRSCGACHNGTRAFDVKTNCQRCHAQ